MRLRLPGSRCQERISSGPPASFPRSCRLRHGSHLNLSRRSASPRTAACAVCSSWGVAALEKETSCSQQERNRSLTWYVLPCFVAMHWKILAHTCSCQTHLHSERCASSTTWVTDSFLSRRSPGSRASYLQALASGLLCCINVPPEAKPPAEARCVQQLREEGQSCTCEKGSGWMNRFVERHRYQASEKGTERLRIAAQGLHR